MGEKTVFKKQVETDNVLPRTLTIKQLKFTQGDVEMTFHGVYGGDDSKVWCATFFDSDEAMAWIQASTVFGRPVLGGVIPAQQEMADEGIQNREPTIIAS